MLASAGTKIRLIATLGAALLWMSGVARAQSNPESAPQTQTQTFQVESIRSGFLLAPDVKFTQLDGRFGNLVGGYGGWLEDQKLFVGAGAYWLTNGSRDTELTYGGAIVEWFATRSEAASFSLRALVGGGSGSLPVSIANTRAPAPPPAGRFGRSPEDSDRFGRDPFRRPGTVAGHVGFFVAEPQMNVFFKMGDWLRLGVGAGYRFIGGGSGLDNRLKGATANLALQFRFF